MRNLDEQDDEEHRELRRMGSGVSFLSSTSRTSISVGWSVPSQEANNQHDGGPGLGSGQIYRGSNGNGNGRGTPTSPPASHVGLSGLSNPSATHHSGSGSGSGKDRDKDKDKDSKRHQEMQALQVSLSLSLGWNLRGFSLLLVSCFMWSDALGIQLWLSSIITFNITCIAYNHYTDIYHLLNI